MVAGNGRLNHKEPCDGKALCGKRRKKEDFGNK